MEFFDLALYTAAILAVLWLRAEPTPATVATEPQAEPTVAPQTELATIADPLPAIAQSITEPAAVAVVKVSNTEPATDYAALPTPELRKMCSQRGIQWRNARGKNKHMPKAAMISALTA